MKNIILKFFFFLCKILTQIKGVSVGKGCVINKLPYIRKCKGSKIILHDFVTLTSSKRHNPTLLHSVGLRTLAPNAVIEMGAYSGISGSTIACCNKITIGEHTIIGPNSLIYDSEAHDYNPEVGWRQSRVRSGRPISIGSKCFIASHCIILSGVTIGDNCVVSAGSVVTQDIPSGHIAKGNPASYTPLPKALGGPQMTQSSNLSHSEEKQSLSMDSFLQELKEILEFERELVDSDEFRSYEEWDSLAYLTIVAHMHDNYGITITAADFNAIKTWKDLYRLIP